MFMQIGTDKRKINKTYNGGHFMCMHADRYQYTKSPIWPVVPFKLTQMNENERKRMGVEYSVGMDSEIVKGWSMMIAEEIGHAVLIYDRPLLGENLAKLETNRFYSELAPVCSKLRDYSNTCFENCIKQDEKVVSELFASFDSEHADDSDPQRIGGFDICIKPSDESIHINVIYDEEDRILSHFEYICPTTGMTELAFPVLCEDLLIAMVVTGQIIENPEDVEQRVNAWCETEASRHEQGDRVSPSFDWKAIIEREKKKSEIITKVRKSIIKLEQLYQTQVDGERRRILNGILNEITVKLAEWEETDSSKTDTVFDDKQGMYKKLTRSIIELKEKMGVEHIYLYWDDNLTSEPYIDGDFYSEWRGRTKPGDSEWIQHPQDAEDGIGDLFNVKEGRIEQGKIPSDDTWSVFIYRPTDDSVEPIIFGIKYSDKQRYLYSRNKDLYWEKYILHKYAIFIQSLASSRIARLRADVLADNRTIQEHEMGQINTAVQILGTRFDRYINTAQNTLRAQFKGSDFYSTLEHIFSEYVHRSKLYRQDMEGQFHLIYMMSKIYDELEVNARTFDVYSEFLNKWRFCFNAKCMEKFNGMNVQTYISGNQIRRMYTDPQMLEYAIYNIVNNAIKYSYINTQVSVELLKSDDDKYHIFTVTDYGLYLDSDDDTIYDKGVQKAGGFELLSVRKNEDSIEGKTEGKGLGLYWCKRLANALGCEISHDCKEVSEYYVPLLRPFLNKYRDSMQFRTFWNNELKKFAGKENVMSHEAIKREYNRLVNESKEYDQIVTNLDETFGNRIGEYVIFDEINKSTNRVTFTIKVPKYSKGGNVNAYSFI